MIKIAMPVFGDRISNRLDCAENIQVTEIKNNKIVKQEVVKMYNDNQLEKINLLIQINPDTVICDGITEICNIKLAEKNINVIPWIQGNSKDIINKYLTGKLYSHTENLITKE